MQNVLSDDLHQHAAAYTRAVRARLIELRHLRVTWTLENVLRRMRGAPPEVIMSLAPDLEPSEAPDYGQEDYRQEFEPHPLDFDWRFDRETISRLLQRVDRATALVLMGVPSLLTPLTDLGAAVVLLDRNQAVAPALHVDFRGRTTRHIIPSIARPTLLMDPPWYPDAVEDWLGFAFENFASASALSFSLWPELTRPTAADERLSILNWLKQFGRITIEPDFLAYRSPLFEKLAYAERGIGIGCSWRRGDLVTFYPHTLPRPRRVRSDRMAKRWIRYLVGERQIAISDDNTPGPPDLLPLSGEPNWHLDTVSRRDPRREQVELWTSNNIVARLRGHRIFMAALAGFFDNKGAMQEPCSEHQHALELLRDCGAIRLDRNQSFAKWQHQE